MNEDKPVRGKGEGLWVMAATVIPPYTERFSQAQDLILTTSYKEVPLDLSCQAHYLLTTPDNTATEEQPE